MHTRKIPATAPLAAALTIAAAAVCGNAQAETLADDQAVTLDRLTVVGSTRKAHESTGSATYLDTATLEKHDYRDVQRILRQVNGVYAIDEEGYGLRPNIGIRGSGTDRSSRITVMEDGVLIAPAAYAAPAAYYFPTAARMSAVEVRKGSSTIRTGPRTTGGAINLISTPIPSGDPQETSRLVDFAYGSDQTVQAHAWAGGSSEHVGWLFETAQQQSDGFKRLDSGGNTGYTLEDYLGKFRINTGPDARYYQSLELKLGKVEQDGDETYLGLTEADFRARPNRRYAGSQVDNIQTDHEQVELRHYIQFTDALDLTTVAYRNEFSRNWYKLNDVRGANDCDQDEPVGFKSISSILSTPECYASQYAVILGGNSDTGALRVRNNNREYYSRGVQSVLGWTLDAGGAQHAFEFSVRYHEDQEDRYQSDDRYTMQNGTMVLASRDAPGSQDNRIGDAKAVSVYLQDEIRAGDWIITPGLRYESIDLTQTRYSTATGDRSAPTGVQKDALSELLPGLGVTYLVNDRLNVFASAHKGLNPPGPGSSADPEQSTNVEAGLRWNAGAMNAEIAGFWNDYGNLVGTCTASTGGNCEIGDQFDGGKARVRGIEAGFGCDVGIADGLRLPLRAGYTLTDAEFRNSFSSDFEEWGDVESGAPLPYLPEHAFNVQAGLEGERWRVNLAGSYIDDMATTAEAGAPRTESAFVIDLAAGYRLTGRAEVFARVENLTDEVWIASLRPAGARPGLPRQTYVGVRVKF
jgi:Fe(3+) dicitrate transport protein